MNETVTEINNQGSQTTENNMSNEELKAKANEAINTIQLAQGRLQEVQDVCKHTESEIVLTHTLQIKCNVCSKIIGYPTQKQIEQWIS